MPEIVAHGIRIKDVDSLFGEYQVTDADLARYRSLISEDRYEEAIDEFVQTYMVDYAELYNATILDYMQKAQEGQIQNKDLGLLLTSVGALSLAMKKVMADNFKTFSGMLAKQVMADNKIRSEDVKAMILRKTLQEFEEKTASAMAETANNVLMQIRSMQTVMIVENQRLARMDIIGKVLTDEVSKFKSGLRARFPEYYEAIETGNILKSRRFGPDGQLVKRFRLADYAEMATRTTLLNVDRTAVEVSASVDNQKAVQLYLRDHRTLKTGPERDICKSIIASGGILALDSESGKELGIMTLDEARAAGCMGPNCRHSIQRVPKSIAEKLAA